MKKLIIAALVSATPALAQEYPLGGADYTGSPPPYPPPTYQPAPAYRPAPVFSPPAYQPAPTPAYQPPPAQPPATYTPRKVWDAYVPSTGRYIHRTLLVGSDGNYRIIAMDHDITGNSNGGSTCTFNAAGSDCIGNGGNHYQLKASSIRYFINIANGAEPY